MKTAIAFGRGAAAQTLRIEDRPDETPGAGEVRVRIHASGANPSDVKARSGAQGPMPAETLVPHNDGAGVIEAVGTGVPAHRVGEHVWLFNVNRTDDGLGQGLRGTAAETLVVDAQYATPLPHGISFEAGACLGVPAMTAHRALYADGPVAGQWVLVTGGAGAVGLSAIQLALHGGARVITTVSGAEKAAVAKAAGAEAVINYREEDIAARVLEITGGQKIDRIVDVALSDHMTDAHKYLKSGGTIAHYATNDPQAPLPYRELLMMNAVIRFVFVYAIDLAARQQAITDINAALRDGVLSPLVYETFPLDQIIAAHELIEAGGAVGNVILSV